MLLLLGSRESPPLISTKASVIKLYSVATVKNNNSINYTNINISSPAKPFVLMKSENSELHVGISRRIS